MPYPDDPSPATTPPLPDEELSGTEKHWNQTILAVLAIGTTVLGVTSAPLPTDPAAAVVKDNSSDSKQEVTILPNSVKWQLTL